MAMIASGRPKRERRGLTADPAELPEPPKGLEASELELEDARVEVEVSWVAGDGAATRVGAAVVSSAEEEDSSVLSSSAEELDEDLADEVVVECDVCAGLEVVAGAEVVLGGGVGAAGEEEEVVRGVSLEM